MAHCVWDLCMSVCARQTTQLICSFFSSLSFVFRYFRTTHKFCTSLRCISSSFSVDCFWLCMYMSTLYPQRLHQLTPEHTNTQTNRAVRLITMKIHFSESNFFLYGHCYLDCIDQHLWVPLHLIQCWCWCCRCRFCVFLWS